MRKIQTLDEIHQAVDPARLAYPGAAIPELSEKTYSRMFSLIELLYISSPPKDRKNSPHPVSDALELLRSRIEESERHWKASTSLGQEEREFRLRRLASLDLELKQFQFSTDWLLETRVTITQRKSHYLSEKLAHIISYEWKEAGANDISPGRNSPLVTAVRNLLMCIEEPSTVDAIAGVLREREPSGGWGSQRPFDVRSSL